jgi:hypothetical protein
MDISNIINVSIAVSAATVTQKGFGTLHIVGQSGRFTSDTAREYTSLMAVAADFQTGDKEYLLAQAYFSANPRPEKVLISQIDASAAQVDDVIAATLGTGDYTVTINGQAATKNYAVAPADKSTVATDLKAAIDALALPVTVALQGSAPNQSIRITATKTGVTFTDVVTANLTKTAITAAHGPVTALTALLAAGYTDWFGLMLAWDAATSDDFLQVAAFIETQSSQRLFGIPTDDVDALDPASTTDIAYLVKAAAYNWTFVMYDDNTNLGTNVAAWFGKMLPDEPGTSNWANKTLTGQIASVLTDSQISALEGKNANYYITVAGQSLTRKGTVAGGSGQWIDVMVGIAWLQSIMQQDLFTALVTTKKIPYTDAGIASVCSIIRADLDTAVSRGVLTEDYELPIPKASDYTSAQKQSRELPGLTFTAPLAGAVNEMTVVGTVHF